MSQELQLSVGTFGCSKSLNMRRNIAIDEKKNMLFIPIQIVNVLVVYICNYYSDN